MTTTLENSQIAQLPQGRVESDLWHHTQILHFVDKDSGPERKKEQIRDHIASNQQNQIPI